MSERQLTERERGREREMERLEREALYFFEPVMTQKASSSGVINLRSYCVLNSELLSCHENIERGRLSGIKGRS